jgi:hypothetical protein
MVCSRLGEEYRIDGASDQPRLSRESDGLCHHVRRIPERVLQIGGNRQIGRIDDHARVHQRRTLSQTAVAASDRNGGSCARGGQSLKSRASEEAGGRDVQGFGITNAPGRRKARGRVPLSASGQGPSTPQLSGSRGFPSLYSLRPGRASGYSCRSAFASRRGRAGRHPR